jgi:diacylglycerol kinase
MKNRSLRESFANALAGIRDAFREERNVRVHIGAVVVVMLTGVLLEIDPLRWALLALACGIVLAAELFNTAMERAVDMITRERSEAARRVKDLAAGAVFVTALFAALCGVAVLAGPLLAWLGLP